MPRVSLEDLRHFIFFFFSSRRRHTRYPLVTGSSDVCSSDLGKRLLSMPNFASVVNPEARAALEAKLPAWVGELVQRGVAERKARQLALDVADEQPVSDQIEYAEYLIQQDRRGRGKIANPAGFFIWAVESNIAVPQSFETTAKRSWREAREQSDGEQRCAAMEQHLAYQEFCTEIGRA